MSRAVQSVNENENRAVPIQVLHVLSSLAVRNGMLGVVENYHEHLNSADVHFDYVYFFDLADNRKKEIEEGGSRTFYLPFQKSKRPFETIEAFFANHDGEFDILHCHPPFAPQLFARAAKRHGVKRVIAHSHSTKFSNKRVSAARNWFLSKFVGLFATDYIACSEEARVLLGSHGHEAFILRNAIDSEKFTFDAEARVAVRKELGVEDGTLLLGSVGRLSSEKNQSFMLDVLGELKRRSMPCVLALAGSGDCEDALRARARELGISDAVRMLGNRSDANRLYSAFDAFLLTSLFEGVPVSAVEAQACGLPCYLSDVITRDVAIGNATFLSVDLGPSVWADTIIGSDNSRMESDEAGARIRAASFDVRGEADRLSSFYHAILQPSLEGDG